MEKLSDKIPVLLTAYNKKETGEVHLRIASTSERFWKAFGAGFAGLLITTVMIAIPILHFILVPIGLLLTIGVVTSVFNNRVIIVGGQGNCACCGKEIFFVQRKAKFPFLERCTECSRESMVTELVKT